MRNAFARTDPGWFHDERFGSLYSRGCSGKQMTMPSAAEFEHASPQITLSSDSIW